MRKGKHVLTEKLMAHDVALCKEMCRVAADPSVKDTNRQSDRDGGRPSAALQHSVRQRGRADSPRADRRHPSHSRPVASRPTLPGNDSWQPPLPGDEKLTKELDRRGKMFWLASTEMFQSRPSRMRSPNGKAKIAQKQAQMNDINGRARAEVRLSKRRTIRLAEAATRTALEELIRWRLWNRTAGGLMAELGSHQLDASSIFISAQGSEAARTSIRSAVTGSAADRCSRPTATATTTSTACSSSPARATTKTRTRTKWPTTNKKIVVTYSSINGNGFGGYGEIVFGTKGTLILEQSRTRCSSKARDTSTKIEVNEQGRQAGDGHLRNGRRRRGRPSGHAGGPVSRGYKEEIEHWAWCIRNPDPKNKPHCTPEVALGDAVIALTSQPGDRQANANRIRTRPGSTRPATKRRKAAAAAIGGCEN